MRINQYIIIFVFYMSLRKLFCYLGVNMDQIVKITKFWVEVATSGISSPRRDSMTRVRCDFEAMLSQRGPWVVSCLDAKGSFSWRDKLLLSNQLVTSLHDLKSHVSIPIQQKHQLTKWYQVKIYQNVSLQKHSLSILASTIYTPKTNHNF